MVGDGLQSCLDQCDSDSRFKQKPRFGGAFALLATRGHTDENVDTGAAVALALM